MNKVIISGRLVRDPEISVVSNGDKRCAFSLAVRKNAEEANFINCTAWRVSAERMEKYAKKGKLVAVIGSLENRSFTTKEGAKRNITEVLVNEIEFLDNKSDASEGSQATSTTDTNPSVADIFKPIDDDSLPF